MHCFSIIGISDPDVHLFLEIRMAKISFGIRDKPIGIFIPIKVLPLII